MNVNAHVMHHYNPATGDWNDSLVGDFLWSRVNLSEALPDVMTPSTWSLWQIFYFEANPIRIPGDFPVCGNICGRPYFNLGLTISLYKAVGKDIRQELHGDMIGSAPPDLRLNILPFSPLAVIWKVAPGMLRSQWYVMRDKGKVPKFAAETPDWCRTQAQKIKAAKEKSELAQLWRVEIKPYFRQACWLLRGTTLLFSDSAVKLKLFLSRLVGEVDANMILSNLAGSTSNLESLGPVLGLAQVRQGLLSREKYIDRYGHRGPHELELSETVPEEDPGWLDRHLAELDTPTMDADFLLAEHRAEFTSAWARFQEKYPRLVKSTQQKLDRVAAAARDREVIRSEITRITRLVRKFVFRVGELTGLGESVFFLSFDEMIDLLLGDGTASQYIPARQKTHARYCALPAYPVLINGPFNPFKWAADPNRRSDYFDSQSPSLAPVPKTIQGFAGSAGCIEGIVRILDDPEQGDQLKAGEVLVAVTTNVGWTPLFPRAAAVVTDVGAPLSHAAIVARELGIPAVVGCGNATSQLKTGDRVRVDGGKGLVEVLPCKRTSTS
jgi:phosphohistidine swiveling domain-containing protein